MAPIRVAAVQAAAIAYDLPKTLVKLRTLVQEASAGGAALAVFPEAFLTAYPMHLSFAIGSRTDENRVWYKNYVESAVKVPDGAEGSDWLAGHEAVSEGSEFFAFHTICSIAKEFSIHLSVGIIERSLVGATLWCCNILVSPEGILLSKHRKLQPTACERVVWSQGHARNESPFLDSGLPSTDNLPVVSTSIGKVGGLICWENKMVLPRFALYKKGVEIYTAPTADGRLTWAPIMQTIAQEGRCFVVSSNQFHTPTDFPSSYPPSLARTGAAAEEVWSRGGSCIVDPLGHFLAGPLWDKAGIIYADIDLERIEGAKLDFDPVGHYAREDLFEFRVRT